MTAARRPSLDAVLLSAGAGLLAATAVLLVLLSALPHRQPFLADTVSAGAYGAHRSLVFAVLLLFGIATAALALSLGLRLRSAAGTACGSLVGVWAVAAVFDAFVRTSRTHTGTAFDQVHTMMAVAGIAAQVFAALSYLWVVHRRLGRVPARLSVVTGVVLAGVVFVAVHPNSLAGLCERVLLAASALWMLVSVRIAPPPPPPTPAPTRTRQPVPGNATISSGAMSSGRADRETV